MTRNMLIIGVCALALAGCTESGANRQEGQASSQKAAVPAAEDPAQAIDSENTVYPVAPVGKGRTGDMQAAYAGDPGQTQESTSTDEEFERLKKLPPLDAPIGAKRVFGEDDRKQIFETRQFPESAQVLVELPDGRCSGAMIGKDLVLTAGHCVHAGRGGAWKPWARVYPGKNGQASPYGSCRSRKLYSVVGWVKNSDPNFDIGAIKLDCDVGQRTGWMGFFWRTATLVGADARISSYPGDKPLEQWTHSEPIRSETTNQTRYRTDTMPGNSGSGAFAGRGAPQGCGHCVHSVHAYGGSDANAGTRITQPLFENLVRWKAEP